MIRDVLFSAHLREYSLVGDGASSGGGVSAAAGAGWGQARRAGTGTK